MSSLTQGPEDAYPAGEHGKNSTATFSEAFFLGGTAGDKQSVKNGLTYGGRKEEFNCSTKVFRVYLE